MKNEREDRTIRVPQESWIPFRFKANCVEPYRAPKWPNRALQPRPAAPPTPALNAGGYDLQAGERRLVCEQWNGQQWVIVPVAAAQCQP